MRGKPIRAREAFRASGTLEEVKRQGRGKYLVAIWTSTGSLCPAFWMLSLRSSSDCNWDVHNWIDRSVQPIIGLTNSALCYRPQRGSSHLTKRQMSTICAFLLCKLTILHRQHIFAGLAAAGSVQPSITHPLSNCNILTYQPKAINFCCVNECDA